MGLSKSDLFSKEHNEIAALARAFAHPARVAIVFHLLETKDCINGELVQELGLAQATISQHLRELKELEIIRGTIEGTKMSYCINPDKWFEIKQVFDAMFDRFEQPTDGDCC